MTEQLNVYSLSLKMEHASVHCSYCNKEYDYLVNKKVLTNFTLKHIKNYLLCF